MLEVDVAGEGPHSQATEPLVLLDDVQARDLVDVDEDGRIGQPQLHQRQQTVPARQDFGVFVGPQQVNGIGNRARGRVPE